MKRSKFACAMIRKAIDKGIRDIRENPERGIRNLVDLGGTFANGRFQKDFFQVAQRELSDKKSGYYQLVERTVRQTDPKILATYGFNLGYNSWTYGAGQIREIETQRGYNIPWTVLMEWGEGVASNGEVVSDLVRQGKALGIYFYAFWVEGEGADLKDLLDALDAEKECAFLLFMPGQRLNAELAERIKRMQTVAVVVDLDDYEREQGSAIALLMERDCLYGGFTRYQGDLSDVAFKMDDAARSQLLFLIYLNVDQPPVLEKRDISLLRNHLRRPILPIDYLADAANIDRIVSTEYCMAKISSDGVVVVQDQVSGQSDGEHNLLRESLSEIFAQTTPKRRMKSAQA